AGVEHLPVQCVSHLAVVHRNAQYITGLDVDVPTVHAVFPDFHQVPVKAEAEVNGLGVESAGIAQSDVTESLTERRFEFEIARCCNGLQGYGSGVHTAVASADFFHHPSGQAGVLDGLPGDVPGARRGSWHGDRSAGTERYVRGRRDIT